MTSLGSVSSFLFCLLVTVSFFFFKQKTAYEMRISDWSSDVCSSDLKGSEPCPARPGGDYPVQGRAIVLRPVADGADQPVLVVGRQLRADAEQRRQIGRASCRERGCQYV